jgi:hypothetical protein
VETPESMLKYLDAKTKKYVLHIAELCREYGIDLECKEGGGSAWWGTRKVCVPPPSSAVKYATALHEVGHIVGGMQKGRKLEKETGAWLWARENAIEWSDDMERRMHYALGTYFAWAERDARAWIPPPEHVSWKLANRRPSQAARSRRFPPQPAGTAAAVRQPA